MNYAHLLQDLRNAEGMSQAEVAKLFGYANYNAIGRMEAGHAPVNEQVKRLVLLWQRWGIHALRAVQP